MKRILAAAAAVCILCCGCSVTLMGNSNQQIPYETFDTKPQPEDPTKMIQYKSAMGALAGGNYTKAQKLFAELGDFKDAAEYLSRFVYIPDTLLCTEQYTDGVLTNTTPAVHNSTDGSGKTASDGGILISTEKSEEHDRVEHWMYDEYTLVNTYRKDGTLFSQKKMPRISKDPTADYASGHYISYYYNPDGTLAKDQGQEMLYAMHQNVQTVDQLNFQGSYTYNAAGLLILYERVHTWGGMGTYTERYTYDENNNLIRFESSKQGNVFLSPSEKLLQERRTESSLKEYRYDKAGNLVFERLHTVSAVQGEDPTVMDTQFEYDYDEDGNQIYFSQKTVSSAAGQETQTSYIQTVSEYEKGRLTLETTTFGDTSDTVIETYYVYGDYLGYIAEEMEVADNGS